MPRSHEARTWPSKARPVSWSLKSHLELGLQPRELPAPEGRLSVNGELISSSLPRHLPPGTHQRHMALGGRGACGGASPGRLCREPWELRLVGGSRGQTHVQAHTRAPSLPAPPPPSFLLARALSLQLLQRHISLLGQQPPDWGLTQRSPHCQKWQGTLATSPASPPSLSATSRALCVRIRAGPRLGQAPFENTH